MAEPVECFRVLAAAVPAERPWCLDLLVAAVLAWFGGDEHYVETLHVPAIMVLGERALRLLVEGFVLCIFMRVYTCVYPSIRRTSVR